jgi:hypothetical protein
LPDQIEAQLGSDATLADSDGNGVSDGVEYRTSGRPCKDVRCGHDILLRNNYAICEGFKNHVEPDGVNASPYGTLIMNDRDHDGLNDCEEMILNSDPTDFDSNLNGLTDFLEFKNRLPFIAGTNAAFSDPDSDRMTNYTEIKTGMPPFVPNGKLTGITPSKYDIVKESSEGGVDCYHLTVNDISIIGPNNQMRVYLMENTAAIDARRTLRVAIGSLREFETTVTFNNDDFR